MSIMEISACSGVKCHIRHAECAAVTDVASANDRRAAKQRHVACCAFLLGNRRKQLVGDTFSEEFAARFSQKHAAAATAAAVSRQSSYLGIAIIAMANRRHRRKLERMT